MGEPPCPHRGRQGPFIFVEGLREQVRVCGECGKVWYYHWFELEAAGTGGGPDGHL